jgi:hypothetical protein
MLPVLIVLAAMLPAGPAWAATTHLVDDDGQATAASCDALGSASTTIQAAVAAASTLPGDTIKVCPGIYSEGVTVNKSVTLLGPQAGVDARSRSGAVADEAVLNGSGPPGAHVTPLNVTANNVTIDGFTVQDVGNANQFGFNILLGAGTSGHTVQNDIIRRGIAGLSLGSDSTTIRQNVFEDNNRSGPVSGTAIYTDQFNAGGTLSNVTIDSNQFVNNTDAGVLLGSTQPGSQTGITVSNNTFDKSGNAYKAFNLGGSSFTRNVVTDSVASSVVVGGGVSGLAITENVVRGTGTRAVLVGDFGGGSANSGLTVTCNSLTGHAVGLEINSGAGNYTGNLLAGFNWWGSATGPTTARNPGGTGLPLVDPASQVVFQPFLTDGADSDPATAGFQCAPKASISDVRQAEGNSGTAAFDFTVTLNNPGPTPVTVQYATENGTAVSGSDYQAKSGTLTFASGERTKTISVPVAGDTTFEPDETFKVRLSSPSGATLADAEGLGTIVNDDQPPAQLVDKRPPKIKVKAITGPGLLDALKHGLGVNVTTNEPGSASIVARVSGRNARGLKVAIPTAVNVVARGKARFKKPGTKRVVVKFTRKAKKKFRSLDKLKLTLKVSVADVAGNVAKTTRKVTLKR